MRLRIKLSDADRKKYGLDEWLDLDLGRAMLSDIKRVKLEVGMEWVEFHNAVVRGSDYALGAATWLAVRRTNDVAWDDVEVDVRGCQFEAVADDPNSLAPGGAKTSLTKSPRSSRASTASTRGTSRGSRGRSSPTT